MKFSLFIIIAIILTSNVNAQTGETELYAELEKAEKELNDVYNKLINKLTKLDKEAFVKSQTDWIKFKESNCIFLSKEKSEGGVIANKMKIDCEIEMNKKRKEEIDYLNSEF
jgi:uncharacterized protein YecT (DUF1311 family)